MLLPTISTALIVLATLSVLFAANWLVWGSGVFAGEDTERKALNVKRNAPVAANPVDDGGFKHVA